MEEISFENITSKHGLSSDAVTDILQDSKGFLWVATQDGLNRFDGESYKRFLHSPKDPNTLSAPWVRGVEEDKFGKIWVATDKGISILDQYSQSINRLSNDNSGIKSKGVTYIYKDVNESMWIIGNEGVELYNYDSQRFEKIRLEDDLDTDIRATAIYGVNKELLLIGTANKGVFIFHIQTKKIEKANIHFDVNKGISKNIKYPPISKFLIDRDGYLWVGTDNSGVFRTEVPTFNLSESTHLQQLPNTEPYSIIDLVQDNQGDVWFATKRGLGIIKKGTQEHLMIVSEPRRTSSLLSNNVQALLSDRNGILWVGTFAGLSKWNTFAKKFTSINARGKVEYSLSGSDVTGIDALDNEWVFVSHLQGLDKVNLYTGKVVHFSQRNQEKDGLLEPSVMSVKAKSHEEVWVGYRSKGASKINTNTMKYSHYEFESNNQSSIGFSAIPYILQLSNEQLWFATFGGGLSKYNSARDNFITYKKSDLDRFTLSSNKIVSAYEASSGLIWLGSIDNGINIFNPITESNYRVNDSIPTEYQINEFITGLVEDDSGNMWVATAGKGLVLMESSSLDLGRFTYQMITREDGMPSNTVTSIEYGIDGHIWASTTRGLVRVNPNTLQIKVYTSAHGLPSNEFNSLSSTELPDGRLVFGGSNGITVFSPEALEKEVRYFPIEITQFQKINDSYIPESLLNENREIVVNHDDYILGFEFAGLDFVSPKDNKFKYKLEGFDPNWVDADKNNKAIYTNLPSGRYTFRVIGSNSDGHWNEEGASLDLVVLPPIWRTSIAYGIYLLVLFILLLIAARIVRMRVEAEKRYREKLENEVSERTRELRKLNTELLQNSITDQLTGLYNRRHLNTVLPDIAKEALAKFSQVIEQGETSTKGTEELVAPRIFFLMFDMDGFKPVNDTYGHDAGDKVIEQVASILKEVCRVNDLVVRWGGDEFLIVGHVNRASEVSQLAERIRSTIAGYAFDLGVAQPIHLSSSIGFSLYPFCEVLPDALTWDHVHILADNALYKSKEFGRNTWTGVLAADTALPYSELNQITSNVERAIDKCLVRIVSSANS
ncbi:ligand-binding sensor domain-containing protein [Agaribacter flavus]|uniref:Two-component regulator propeller domain-containing protein n=1 Tax=Agaribacter flavus TaxID=1902781 RepID=A0ABV7FS71_9ALTE